MRGPRGNLGVHRVRQRGQRGIDASRRESVGRAGVAEPMNVLRNQVGLVDEERTLDDLENPIELVGECDLRTGAVRARVDGGIDESVAPGHECRPFGYRRGHRHEPLGC